MLDESKIASVVCDIAERNECCEESDCRDKGGFAQTSNDHGRPLSKKVVAAGL
jgi:hypothetical protein